MPDIFMFLLLTKSVKVFNHVNEEANLVVAQTKLTGHTQSQLSKFKSSTIFDKNPVISAFNLLKCKNAQFVLKCTLFKWAS